MIHSSKFVVIAILLVELITLANAHATGSGFVSRSQCAQCHSEEVELWRGSHHDLAMQEADAETVLGDFENAEFTHFGLTSRFYRDDDRYYVETDGPDGKLTEYEIRYTFGVDPLQQYLVELSNGRIQALPLAWDTRPLDQGGQRWFHLNPGEPVPHDDPLHWTGPALNWNNMCAECHSTAYVKGYDTESDSFESGWSEIDVSCEACHGPADKHVEWAREYDAEAATNGGPALGVYLNERAMRSFDTQTGIAKRTSAPSPMMQVETCALCHSRRGATGTAYQHGRPLIESHIIQTLEDDLYFADGQIKDEVYVYGSFLQSKMYADGVVCSDCHEPHSLKLRAEGNGVCSTCHLPDKFDTPAHHHHEPGTDGAQCVNCHMTARTYMVIDDRRDHSFRVPRPDLSMSIGSPDACTSCHEDRKPEWAANVIKEQWGGKYHEKPHFAYVLDAAHKGALNSEQMLLSLASDASQPAIVRATAVRALRSFMSPATVREMAGLLNQSDPMIRMSALPMLESLEPADRARIGAGLLDDPVASIRLEVARVLGDVQSEHLSEAQQIRLSQEIAQYVDNYTRESDVTGNNVNLGNLYTRFGVYADAEEWYLRAIRMSPHYLPSYINLADLYRLQGQEEKGKALLKDALSKYPGSGSLQHAYGLLLIRTNQYAEANDALRKATELEQDNVRFRYVYAIALQSSGKIMEAIQELEKAYETFPADTNVLNGLINFNQQIKNQEKVLKYAKALSQRLPWDENLKAFIQQSGMD
ncbi:MAG: multiheme c-type cytochrome [Gammaproteobacteria bacterium]